MNPLVIDAEKIKGRVDELRIGIVELAQRCEKAETLLAAAVALLASYMADSDAEMRARLDKLTVEELFAEARKNIERAGG